MEKICIAKRRRIGFGPDPALRYQTAESHRCSVLAIELTQKQMEIVRTSTRFQGELGNTEAPIILNLRIDNALPTKLLKSDQICDMLQISRRTLSRLVKSGSLRNYRIGRLQRFDVNDVMELLSKGIERGSLRAVRPKEIFLRPKRN